MAPAASTPKVWTTRALLAWMIEAFTKHGLDAPRLSGEMLLGHVIGCDRLRLYTDADRPASPLERDKLRDLVARALRHEPVQYLVGEKWFFGLPLHVDPRVLIPRPSTETIIEEVLRHTRAQPEFGGKHGEGMRFADICTGSGCIAVAILKHLSGAVGIATDISAGALEVAHANAQRHAVLDRLELLQGDLLTPLIDHPAGGGVEGGGAGLHFLLANPPYIPDDEWPGVEANVKDYEPHAALRGGADGMDFVRPLIAGAAGRLRPHGIVMLEVAAQRAREAAALLESTGDFEGIRIAADFEGLPRVVIGRRRDDAHLRPTV